NNSGLPQKCRTQARTSTYAVKRAHFALLATNDFFGKCQNKERASRPQRLTRCHPCPPLPSSVTRTARSLAPAARPAMTYLEAHPVAGMLRMPPRGARRVPAAIAAARSNCFGSRPQKGLHGGADAGARIQHQVVG